MVRDEDLKEEDNLPTLTWTQIAGLNRLTEHVAKVSQLQLPITTIERYFFRKNNAEFGYPIIISLKMKIYELPFLEKKSFLFLYGLMVKDRILNFIHVYQMYMTLVSINNMWYCCSNC